MSENRMEFDDLADIQGILDGFRQLSQANEQFVARAIVQNERYRESMADIRQEIVRNREALISLSLKDRKSALGNGLQQEVNDNVKAYRALDGAIQRNKQLIDLNRVSVDQMQRRLADLRKEYNSLDRSEARNVQRMGEIQREVRETSTVLNTLTQATQRATRAADAAENSYNKLSQETGELRAKLRAMPDAFDQATGKINKHNRAAVDMHNVIQRNDKALKTMDAGMGNYHRNIGNYGSALSGVARSALAGTAAMLGIGSALEGIQVAFRITSDLERLDAGLRAVSKDSADFANTQNFLMSLADTLGQRYDVLAKSYKGLKAATRDTALEGKATEQIFAGIVRAGSTLQLSNEEIEGSLYAVTQMISKGKVQAEELRQQLGERLPGAMKLLAQSMGVSEARLNGMLEKGELLAVDVLPKLAAQLDKTYGAGAAKNLETMGGNMNQLTNEVYRFFGAMNQDKVITSTVNTFLGGIRDMLKGMRVAIQSEDWKTFFGAMIPGYGGSDSRDQIGRYAQNDKVLAEFQTMNAGMRRARIDLAKEEKVRLQKELDARKNTILGGNKDKIAADLKNQQKLITQLQKENLKLTLKERKDADQAEINAIRASADKKEQAAIQAEKDAKKKHAKPKAPDTDLEQLEKQIRAIQQELESDVLQDAKAGRIVTVDPKRLVELEKLQAQLKIVRDTMDDIGNGSFGRSILGDVPNLEHDPLDLLTGPTNKRGKQLTDAEIERDQIKGRNARAKALDDRLVLESDYAARSFDLEHEFSTNLRGLRDDQKDNLRSLLDEQLEAERAGQQKRVQLIEQEFQRRKALYSEDAQRRRELTEKSIEIGTTLINGLFDIEQERSAQRQATLDAQQQNELEAAGDNEEAKKNIESRYAAQRRKEQIKQARFAQLQALFNIGIDTAQAIMRTTAELGLPAAIPFNIAAGALGAVQAGIVLAKGIPQYKDGKNMDELDRYEGPALVGEAGRELWFHDGKAEMVENPSVLNVGKNDVILSNEVTERLLTDERAMEASRLLGQQQRQEVASDWLRDRQQPTRTPTLSTGALTAAIKAGFDGLELHQWQVVEGELIDVIIAGNQRRINRSNRHRLP